MNRPIRLMFVVVTIMFLSLLVGDTWLQFGNANTLRERPGNARTTAQNVGQARGDIRVGSESIATSVEGSGRYAYVREYSGGEMYSNLLGYFSIYGKTGLEQAENDILAGTSDAQFFSRINGIISGQNHVGGSIQLTIDPALQKTAWDALGQYRGAIVALDPRDGRILAMVSKPSYDNNLFTTVDGNELNEVSKKLQDDPNRPLENRAIASTLYPPGSVFKIVTAAAALNSGDYDPQTKVPGPAKLPLPNSTVELPNFSPRPCGPNNQVTLLVALQNSCNTAFGALGMELGDQTMREQAEKFGFGQDLFIPLQVTPSIFPAEPDQAQLALSSIGQFDVRVSPLQVAMVSAAVANGGVLQKPQLIQEVRNSQSLRVISEFEPEVFSTPLTAKAASDLTTMMQAVVNNGSGMRARIPGVEVAGKTGTAQTSKDGALLTWFTAFAPVDNPKIAIAVVLENVGSGDDVTGGRYAAPIAKTVMEQVVLP